MKGLWILLLVTRGLGAQPDRPFLVEIPEEDPLGRSSVPADAGPREFRRLTLDGLDPEVARERLLAWPSFTGRLRAEDLLVDPSRRALIVHAPRTVMSEVVALLSQLDAPSTAGTATIELSFLDIESLREAVDRLGPLAMGGLRGQDLAWIAPSRQVLVRASPEAVERLRSLVSRLDQAPRSYTIGVRAASTGRTRARRVGLEAPDPLRGGRVNLELEDSRTVEDPILWVATLEGSPARFDAGQIFNVVLPSVSLGPDGATSRLNPQEIFVGTSLDVTPRARGKLVELEIAFSRDSPGRISPIGVDRDSRAVATRVLVPRGGSTTIGGLVDQMRRSGYDGSRISSTDLSLTVHVR